MSDEIRVGIIGAGRWGPNVIGALRRLSSTRVIGVADIDESSLTSLKNRFPDLQTTLKPEELIKSEKTDAIMICTPVATHLDLVEHAIEQGKHVFVEKPFGLDPRRCEKICQKAKEDELELMVGHVFLFNASIVALKEIIKSGELGEVYHLEGTRTNLGPVRNDVNALWDLSSHDLSIFNYLLEEAPTHVSASGSARLDPSIEDTTFASFKFPSGVLAHTHASWLNPRKVRQITVVGSQKMALWDDLNMEHPITIFDSSIGLDQAYYSDSFASHRLSYRKGDVRLPAVPSNEPLLAELSHFVKVLRKEERNLSDGELGTNVVRSLVAADLSLKREGVFVPIE